MAPGAKPRVSVEKPELATHEKLFLNSLSGILQVTSPKIKELKATRITRPGRESTISAGQIWVAVKTYLGSCL